MRTERMTLIAVFLLLLAVCLVGCGKKSKTDVTFRPAAVPLSFKCSKQGDGVWMVSGGVVTPYGILAIEQTFDTREDFTYLVLRDRVKGTDQVFKLGVKGYVELHTIGEHKLRLRRDDNKVVVDVDSISGTFDFNVYPVGEALAKVDFGGGQPDFVIFNDKRLAIQYHSYIWSDDSIPLDSIENVTYERGFGYRTLVFNWKPSIQDRPKPFEYLITDWQTSEKNFLALQRAFAQFVPHVKFEQQRHNAGTIICLGIATFLLLTIVGQIFYYRKKVREPGGDVGCLWWFLLVICSFTLFGALITIRVNFESVRDLFV